MPRTDSARGRRLLRVALVGVLVAVLVAVLSLSLGCLPSGDPPVGQHVVHDRSLSGVYFTASEVAGVPSRVLATGPLRQPDQPGVLPNLTDLLADGYEFPASDETREGLSGSQPFARDLVLQYGDTSQYTFSTDAWGRPIYLTCNPSIPAGPTCQRIYVERFDWTSRAVQYPGYYDPQFYQAHNAAFLLSPGRRRLFANVLFDLALGLDVGLGSIDARQGAFVGEDFFYVATPAGPDGRTSLGRSQPGVKPELLLSSTESLGLKAILGDRTPQLLVTLHTDYAGSSSAGWQAPLGLWNPETKVLAELPAQARNLIFAGASSDGHWLLFRGAAQYSSSSTLPALPLLFAYDWTTGKSGNVDSTVLGDTIAVPQDWWRPGHHEVWFSLAGNPGGLVVWRPDAATDEAAALEIRDSIPGKDGDYFLFTPDGQYWLALAQSPVCLGFADDLSQPLLPLHPPGTGLHAQELRDGRWLIGASTTDFQRQDLSILDPATRTSRLIASGGHVVALGQTRVLTILNWESTRQAGDLTLIDLDSAAQTMLAENVYAAAVDPGTTAKLPPDADRLSPGTRIGFLMRSRLESPYDGLWVATLP